MSWDEETSSLLECLSPHLISSTEIDPGICSVRLYLDSSIMSMILRFLLGFVLLVVGLAATTPVWEQEGFA